MKKSQAFKTQGKESQVTFSHTIHINKNISSNCHLDNILKKLSSRQLVKKLLSK